MALIKDQLKINIYGQAILSSESLIEILLQGRNISHLNVIRSDEDIRLYEQYQSELLSGQTTTFLDSPPEELDFDSFHKERADEWIFPIEFQQIDVLDWCLNKCKTQEEQERVKQEFVMFQERDLIMILRLFIFLINYMRRKDFIWGVGRGSSVSSYILYLIGVHRVDSIKYGLDIKDYLK
jgi:DNA polymerase III alpha subunit